MKILSVILLAAFLSACASPYKTVYLPGGEEYYVTENTTGSGVYGGYPIYPDGIGTYPWWASGFYYGYPPWTFYYYSPNYYPHHFSVSTHPWHYGYRGRFRHIPFCCFPNQPRYVNHPGHGAGGDGPRVVAPVPPNLIPRPVAGDPGSELLRPSYRKGGSRVQLPRNVVGLSGPVSTVSPRTAVGARTQPDLLRAASMARSANAIPRSVHSAGATRSALQRPRSASTRSRTVIRSPKASSPAHNQ